MFTSLYTRFQKSTSRTFALFFSWMPACGSAPGAGLCATDAAQLISRKEGGGGGGGTLHLASLAAAAEYNGRRCWAPDPSLNWPRCDQSNDSFAHNRHNWHDKSGIVYFWPEILSIWLNMPLVRSSSDIERNGKNEDDNGSHDKDSVRVAIALKKKLEQRQRLP